MVDPNQPERLARQAPDTPPVQSTPTPQINQTPAVNQTAQASQTDSDADGVPGDRDECPQSARGFPVDDVGCPLLRGSIAGLEYESDSTSLVEGSTSNLDFVADLLTENPQARIEVQAYTDNSGSPTEQARRTRGRLRSIGVYLVNKGVQTRQLVLRSFAADNPAYDNETLAGRRANNRLEISESPF